MRFYDHFSLQKNFRTTTQLEANKFNSDGKSRLARLVGEFLRKQVIGIENLCKEKERDNKYLVVNLEKCI